MELAIKTGLAIVMCFSVIQILDVLIKSIQRQRRIVLDLEKVAALQEEYKSGKVTDETLSLAISSHFSMLSIETYQEALGMRSLSLNIILIAGSAAGFFYA